MPTDGSADLVVTFDCLHDMTDPAGMVRAIRAALADDGTWLLVDIKAHDTYAENVERNPMASLMYGISVLELHELGAVRARRRRPRHARPVRGQGRAAGPATPASPGSARSTSTTRSTPSTRSARSVAQVGRDLLPEVGIGGVRGVEGHAVEDACRSGA